MKKLISAILISTTAFASTMPTSAFSWPKFFGKSTTAQQEEFNPLPIEQIDIIEAAKENAGLLSLEQIEEQINKLCNKEKENLIKVFGIKEDTNSTSFATKVVAVLGSVLSFAGKTGDWFLKIVNTASLSAIAASLFALVRVLSVATGRTLPGRELRVNMRSYFDKLGA